MEMERWMCFAVVAVLIAAGSLPAAERAPAPVPFKLVTWNILYGADRGSGTNKWPERKTALKAALEKEAPQILCVEEAQTDQLGVLDALFPGHARVGVGREDGKDGGEHCAIYYDRTRFKLLDSGTFWLSETPEKPSPCWNDKCNRVCTWAQLEDSRRVFRVFCVHFPLDPGAREKSANLLLKRLAAVPADEPVLLMGDFNCGPGTPPWEALRASGLRHAETLGGATKASPTWHLKGVPAVCLDSIFASKGWQVQAHRVLDDHLGNVYPSDHFGLCANVVLTDDPARTAR